MMAATPLDQEARLRAIAKFDLGRQVHQGRLDPLVELASQITECPVALVSIVHADAQRFEARCGLDVDSTGLEMSICSHAILQRELLEIPDCSLDARTRDNPLICDREPPFRFYAGAQIVTSQGVVLGSLCVLDEKPRRLSELQKRTLRVLADQAMQVLELHEALQMADDLRREADHRVKNSLAGIAAVARMSAAQATSEETRGALRQVQSRIEATARLHAELYRQDLGEEEIEVSDYLGGILDHLRAMAPPGIEITGAIDPLRLSSSRAAALGLLANEMVSNAFKHGFPDGRAGRIEVTARHDGDGRYVLTCSDDGIGSEAAPSESGLGGRLMEASTVQLGGTLHAGPGQDGRGYDVRLAIPAAA